MAQFHRSTHAGSSSESARTEDRNDKLEALVRQYRNAFQTGRPAGVMARVLLVPPQRVEIGPKANSSIPCRRWSLQNQLICFLSGHTDARGFRQWLEVGRHVKKSETAFFILAPIAKRGPKVEEVDDHGETHERFLRGQATGFRWQAVFGFDQTDGEPLPPEPETRRAVDASSILAVARGWDLTTPPEDASAWARELTQAAEDRNALREARTADSVGELAGAVLLEVLGRGTGASLAVSLEAIERRAGTPAATAAGFDRLVKHSLAAVTLILDTADQLAADRSAAA
jgi:hypothetical protein